MKVMLGWMVNLGVFNASHCKWCMHATAVWSCVVMLCCLSGVRKEASADASCLAQHFEHTFPLVRTLQDTVSRTRGTCVYRQIGLTRTCCRVFAPFWCIDMLVLYD